jgi:hypothetical protein
MQLHFLHPLPKRFAIALFCAFLHFSHVATSPKRSHTTGKGNAIAFHKSNFFTAVPSKWGFIGYLAEFVRIMQLHFQGRNATLHFDLEMQLHFVGAKCNCISLKCNCINFWKCNCISFP